MHGDYESEDGAGLGRWSFSDALTLGMGAALVAVVVYFLFVGGAFGADPGPAQAPPAQAPPVVRETPAAGANQSGPRRESSATTPPPVITYATAREIAPEHGGIVVLIGDVSVPPHEHYYGAPVYRIREGTWPPSVGPGIYHVSRIGGVPHWWRSDWPKYVPTPARVVPAARPFPPDPPTTLTTFAPPSSPTVGSAGSPNTASPARVHYQARTGMYVLPAMSGFISRCTASG